MADCENNTKPRRGTIKRQVFASVAASVGGFAMGSCLSYTSPALPSMEHSTNFSNLTLDEASWFASMAPMAALIACPCTGMSIEQIGRKGTMLLLTMPLLIGWALTGFTDNIWILYGSRFLVGFAAGAYSLVVPIYINETAAEAIRGRLGLLNSVGIYSGVCFPYVAGSFLEYDDLAYALCFVPILIIVLFLFVVESPRYLIANENIPKATEALQWLNGTVDVQDELNLIQKSFHENQKEELHFTDFFTTSSILKPFGISLGLMFFQVATGIDAVIFYSFLIFQDSGANISANLSSIIIGLVILASTIFSWFIIDRFGRRPLLLISELLITISLITLGIYFYLSHHDEKISHSIGWLPLLSLIIWALGYAIGMNPIPWIYLEIIPTRVAGVASGLSACFCWTMAFLVIRFFEIIKEDVGREGSFWIFAILSFLGIFYIYFCVPETKGKTLEEIQLSFK